MVSSFGLHHRNERTLRELMRIHPDEHPVSMQLFGHDAEVMRSGAAIAAEAGADLIDINMGCPVRKVRRTGAGARAAARPRAGAGAGPRRGRGQRPAGHGEAALRASRPATAPASTSRCGWPRRPGWRRSRFHPRAAPSGHKGAPDYALTRELVERVEVPVIVSGGLSSAAAARIAYRESGADAVMIARGALGNPWLVRGADRPPRRAAGARGGRGRAAVGGRPCRGAPRRRAGRRATCASSTPGTSERLGAPAAVADELQRTRRPGRAPAS